MGSRARDVLVVDDEDDIRSTIADVLRDEGCRVYPARDGEEALKIMRAIIPDLIVTDLMMPGVNGWALCETVRRDRLLRGVPIAVLSAFIDVRPIEGVKLIKKPMNVQALVSLLDTVTGR